MEVKTVKIISWNCNCKFREKYKEIIKYNADIYMLYKNVKILKHMLIQNFISLPIIIFGLEKITIED